MRPWRIWALLIFLGLKREPSLVKSDRVQEPIDAFLGWCLAQWCRPPFFGGIIHMRGLALQRVSENQGQCQNLAVLEALVTLLLYFHHDMGPCRSCKFLSQDWRRTSSHCRGDEPCRPFRVWAGYACHFGTENDHIYICNIFLSW